MLKKEKKVEKKMNNIPDQIQQFLKANKVNTVCFINEKNEPYCVNCFYLFDESKNYLILKSSANTSHSSLIYKPSTVSGTILPEKIDILQIKGIQFTGKILDDKTVQSKNLYSLYHKKFPMSLAIPGSVWGIELEFIKFTNNSLGFGNKTIWKI